MILLTIVCIVAVLTVAYLAHRKVEKAILEMRAETSAREAALNKQAKAFVKRLAQSNGAANKMIDECRKSQDEARYLREDTQALQQKINAVLSDPRVKRLLNKVGE